MKKNKKKRFLVITHVVHYKVGSNYVAYAPYVREMNIWLKHVDRVMIIAPVRGGVRDANTLGYVSKDVNLIKVPVLNFTSFIYVIRSLFYLPYICYVMIRGMLWANHIHLRCPGNMGVIGVLLQIFFPAKKKTAKYAGNWDPKSKQPWSYKLQQFILKNTFLTRNIKVLVYGEWPDKNKNILSFFTATYSEKEKIYVDIDRKWKDMQQTVNILFIGTLTPNKRPLFSVKVVQELIKTGVKVRLDIFGNGDLREDLENFVDKNNLLDVVKIHGSVSKEVVKQYMINGNFLLFASMSEGWPKVVAESMWWGCLPITTSVSCVPEMLGNNTRGQIIEANVQGGVDAIQGYMSDEEKYKKHMENAIQWTRKYTLERFENEIIKLL